MKECNSEKYNMETPKHEKSATRKKKVIVDHHAKTLCQNMKRVQHGKSATRKKHKQ